MSSPPVSNLILADIWFCMWQLITVVELPFFKIACCPSGSTGQTWEILLIYFCWIIWLASTLSLSPGPFLLSRDEERWRHDRHPMVSTDEFNIFVCSAATQTREASPQWAGVKRKEWKRGSSQMFSWKKCSGHVVAQSKKKKEEKKVKVSHIALIPLTLNNCLLQSQCWMKYSQWYL